MKKETERIDGGSLFEGIISVRTVISAMRKNGSNDRKIIRVFVSDSRAESQKKEFLWLRAQGQELGFAVETKPEEYISSISVGGSHGGIVAFVSERTIPFLESAHIAGKNFFAMIDGIEDPYNFGYSLRSLYAAGADGIVLGERNWMSAAGIVARSSAGASELFDLYTSGAEEAAKIFSDAGFRIVCADLRDSVSVFDANLSFPVFLIVGGEKRGISRKVLDRSNVNVRIDYGRTFDMSLSAASASTVVAFEIMRYNRKKSD